MKVKFVHNYHFQLEQLQSENEIEWSKREQLESVLMNVERINKQLRSELNDAQEKLLKQNKPESSSDIKFRLLQQELADKNIVCILFLNPYFILFRTIFSPNFPGVSQFKAYSIKTK